VLGDAAVCVLAIIGFAAAILTPSQAFAGLLAGLSLIAFGIGTGHELEVPTAWRGQLQDWSDLGRLATRRGRGATASGSKRTSHARFGARA
jgi:hypothetical protein